MVQEKNKAFRYTFYYGATIVFILGLIVVGIVFGTLHRVMEGRANKTNSEETVQVEKQINTK